MEVRKSFDASQNEGGLAGTIGLITAKPFDYGELDYASPAQQAAGISNVKPLAGLSAVLGNVTFYYENKKWGVRVSANYRSGYMANPIPIADDEGGNGY